MFILDKSTYNLMNKIYIYTFLLFFSHLFNSVLAQTSLTKEVNNGVSKLFLNQDILPVKMSYSNKLIKKETNDSTYSKTNFQYKGTDGNWKELEIDIRVRGNFRLKNCDFAPLKLKINKKTAKGTFFEGNKKLKMVLPCLLQSSKNSMVVKEYIAYKLYELISDYHFKTRILDIELEEIRGKKIRNHMLKGFLIEDDKNVAKRHNGKVLDRFIHPYAQDTLTSIRNAFFQYMIGNTDFSVGYGHNEKLLFIDNKIMPVPYDFDMSGLCNTSYSTVSQIQGEVLPITSVTQRVYRGFKRPQRYFQQVRQEFIDKKQSVFAAIDECKPLCDNLKEFDKAREYIAQFFETLEDDKKFKSRVIDKARTK